MQKMKPAFIGREQELQRYQEFLSADSPWFLVITGMGGSGKTTLLSKMEDQTPPSTPVVRLDFAGEVFNADSSGKQKPIDPLTLLSNFTSQVKNTCDLSAYTNFNDNLRKGRQQLTQRGTTYIGNLTKSQVVDVGQGGTVSGNRIFMEDVSEDPELQEIRRQVREWVTEEFYTLMDTFKPDRLVIMLDSSEWLSHPVNVEIGAWIIKELLLALHERWQGHKKVHVVIAGSMELQLRDIEEQDQDQLKLAELDEGVVTQFLVDMGMPDPELRRRIYEMTYGHPSCISIVCDLWQELKDNEKPASVGDLPKFRQMFNERAVNEFILDHILDKRLKWPFDELTRYGILLRSFNLRLLRIVFSEVFDQSLSDSRARDYYDRFVHFLYIKNLGSYSYTLLDMLRALLAESIRANEPEKWESYHKRALDFLTRGTGSTNLQSHLIDWYYHTLASKIAYDEEPALAFWNETLPKIEANEAELNAMLEAARDATLMSTSLALAAQAYKRR